MKKTFLLAYFLFTLSGINVFAATTTEPCLYHGGIDCSTGPDSDGSIICADGWNASPVSYSSVAACSYIPTYKPTDYEAPTDKNFIPYDYMKQSQSIPGYTAGTRTGIATTSIMVKPKSTTDNSPRIIKYEECSVSFGPHSIASEADKTMCNCEKGYYFGIGEPKQCIPVDDYYCKISNYTKEECAKFKTKKFTPIDELPVIKPETNEVIQKYGLGTSTADDNSIVNTPFIKGEVPSPLPWYKKFFSWFW